MPAIRPPIPILPALRVLALAAALGALVLLGARSGAAHGSSAAGPIESHHKVVFVQGISSESACGATFVELTANIRDFLLTAPWVQSAVPLQPTDFRYFSYDPAPALPDRYCGGDLTQPDYAQKDTCWSVDNKYGTPSGQAATIGSAQRLNDLIGWLIAQDPAVKIDVVAHSQGGVVAAFWLWRFAVPANVNSVVTLDSPVGGLPGLWYFVADFKCRRLGVDPATEPWYDSASDMRDGSATNLAVQMAPARAPVFTMRTSTSDVIVPDAAGAFDGAGCDSSADMVATVCAGPNGPVVDFYAPLGNHVMLWRSPIPEELDLLGCAVIADLSPCIP